MSTLPVSPEVLQRAILYGTQEQKLYLYRLLEARKRLAPLAQPKESISLEEKTKLETDFSFFFSQAWNVICPGKPLYWSWHYDYIAEHLMLVRQKKLTRLIINVPPRTGKSNFATIAFPVWCWIDEPKTAFLCASYSRDLSTEHNIARRNLIMSQWYQGIFGDRFQLSPDRNLTTQFTNDKGGQMLITSTGYGGEGRGGDIAILDDPMSSTQSLSDSERFSANRWISNTLKQRLNDPTHSAIILIMQRLHELDTTGYVLGEDPGEWTRLTITLEAEKDEEFVFPISGKVVKRKKGEVLQPERFTPKVVEDKKRSRLVFAGQYQQRPAPLEGNLIKRSEVKYYGGIDPMTGQLDENLPPVIGGSRFDRVMISVDAAFKDKDDSDYVAILTVGVRNRKRYILDVVNEHLDVNATELVIRRKREQFGATAILVEDKANGPAIVQRLQNSLPGVIEVTPEGGKISRVFAAAPEWQAGDWYVDRSAAWAEPFIQQITMFPTAANDDMCDAMSQASIWLQANRSVEQWMRL